MSNAHTIARKRSENGACEYSKNVFYVDSYSSPDSGYLRDYLADEYVGVELSAEEISKVQDALNTLTEALNKNLSGKIRHALQSEVLILGDKSDQLLIANAIIVKRQNEIVEQQKRIDSLVNQPQQQPAPAFALQKPQGGGFLPQVPGRNLPPWAK